MIRSDLEQSVTRSFPSDIVSGYLDASINDMRQVPLVDAQFREWVIETALIGLQVARNAGFHQCIVNPERRYPRF
jgi:hypothetical protein